MIPRSDKELHRLNKNHNDWDDIPASKFTHLQNIAKKTRGIVTPGNVITLVGSIIVIDGLADFAAGNTWAGTFKVGIGRFSDILDGIVAAKTHTKSRVGRDLDPTADILQLIVGSILLGHAKVLPISLLIVIGLTKTFGVIGSLAARARHVRLDPTAGGKIGTLFLWSGIGFFMLRSVLMHRVPSFADNAFGLLGWICALIGIGLSIPASYEYMSFGFGSTKGRERI
jgi:phosphatidylglycerophosphate synthase